ncbi:hypothetical protein MNBD_GAMMA18-1132 [hydrothermal vent metagenome]|uniref:Cytochrome c domain-containing protein n=1 Tax=hydrothermal vent metagenome TaxID=652676 RepID=A0A3B0ZAI1_9ZZZZ
MVLTTLLSACDSIDTSVNIQVEAPPRNMDAELLTTGKMVYDKHCQRCHGVDGVGSKNWQVQGPDGNYPPPPLNGNGHTWHHPKAVLIGVIKDGSPGGMGNMPRMRDKVNDTEIEALISWMQSLWSEQAYQTWYRHDLAYRGNQPK